MTASPKTFTRSSERKSARRRNLQVAPPAATQFPGPELPASLKALQDFQQATSALALGLVALTLGIYGWTVYIPQRWTQEYEKLERLQQAERQLTANTQALKSQLALQAERPDSGLVKVAPQQNIFLPAAAVSAAPSAKQVPQAPLPAVRQPLSY
ncbi:MAG: hypothetical protein GC158_02645 [Cyanobacteria bacterium RI_101]|jgi:hypothetical protein|nr:hypothetical protein [Cyanobacteria bacterium RI_101]